MSGQLNRGVTIRMFLVDGTPEGLRLVERMGWTGSFLAFSRADYPNVRARAEVSQTGVYVLTGPDPDGTRSQRIYIGEADSLKSRLDSHQKEKDFWTQGFLLTTKDNSLNKAHVRYLEARLISLAREADNASLDNGTAPAPAFLSEPEVAEMETYLDNALPLFPIVGVNVFEAAEAEAIQLTEPRKAGPGPVGSSEFPRLYLATKVADAEGEDRPKGFLVFKGARGRIEAQKMSASYRALRERLIKEGILVEEGDSLVLTRSYLFDSPSAAANTLIGGNRNGRTHWREVGTDKTLKDLQSEAASTNDDVDLADLLPGG